jgi:hypothetical protein
VSDELPDHWKRYCSYIDNQDVPAGFCTNIYWIQEEQIFKILEAEKENGVRIFPRYHYITDLVRKIDALSKYNCESDDFINEIKRQYEFQERKRLEDYFKSSSAGKAEIPQFKPLPFEEFLAEKQNPIINAPNLTGDFLEVLISEPVTLTDIFNKQTESCNYLWSKIEPFEGKDYPEGFPADSDIGIQQDDLKRHNEIITRVQENSTKKYVQNFLKTNLVNFLEEYERTFQANEFSYADIWQLKARYLEGLYKDVINGLSGRISLCDEKRGKGLENGLQW